MDALAVIALGFVIGIRHAADPDHVVAVTAIASRDARVVRAAAVGALWGLGHSITILLVGGAIILFNVVVPPRVGLAFEFTVGLALAVVGLANLTGRREVPHTHAHGHAHGHHHSHPHVHDHDHGHAHVAPADTVGPRAFLVGLVHGLAGSAAVALLVLAAVRDPFVSIVYLAVFCLGTVLGMVLVSLGVSLPARFASRRWPGFAEPLRTVTGVLSIAFGAFLLYKTGWVDGLFRSVPTWRPH